MPNTEKLDTDGTQEAEEEELYPSDYPSNLQIELVRIASALNYKRAWTVTRPLKELIDQLLKSSNPKDVYKRTVFEKLNKAKKLEDIANAITNALSVEPSSIEGLDHVTGPMLTDIETKAWTFFNTINDVDLILAKRLAKLLADGITARPAKT